MGLKFQHRCSTLFAFGYEEIMSPGTPSGLAFPDRIALSNGYRDNQFRGAPTAAPRCAQRGKWGLIQRWNQCLLDSSKLAPLQFLQHLTSRTLNPTVAPFTVLVARDLFLVSLRRPQVFESG